jgi:hypothetical protein
VMPPQAGPMMDVRIFCCTKVRNYR